MKDEYAYRWQWIIDLVRENQYTKGAEVGVFRGRNLFGILNNCPKLHMLAVDQWAPVDGGVKQNTYSDFGRHSISNAAAHVKHMAKKRYPNRVEVLHGPSVEMAKRVEDESLDFVFIDADHRYEFVVEDIKAWFPKVRSGGTLCGHDYGDPRFPGVEKAVKEFFHTYGTTKRHGIWYVTKVNGTWLQ